jgi:hypothetical protein
MHACHPWTAGVGEAYSVGDLAHLLWGCAMLGVVPRQGLINSFAGGSCPDSSQ